MKTLFKKLTGTVMVVLMTTGLWANMASAAGLLKPVSGSASLVQMKSHEVNVTINNGFAKTEVDQIFVNTGNVDVEAVYSFPVPRQASLSEVSLWIDGQEVVGEVMEKQQAKKVYNEQKAKGNDTALAEKNSYKTFDVRVSPVRAGRDTRIRLVYYQPVEIDLNIGRYVYHLEEGGFDKNQNAFWSVDDVVNETFNFNLKLKSAYPVKNVRVPDYEQQAVITKTTSKENNMGEVYDVHLSFPEGSTLSKDIVFYYRLKDTTPARVELVPYRDGEDGSFMVVVTPGGALERISEGTDWTFVLDVSGSMSGEKIYTLGEGVAKVINKMSPEDRFRVITFSSGAQDFSRGYRQATKGNIIKMAKNIKNLKTGGSTALFAGLEMAYKGMDHDRTTGIILVTDGVANDGPSKDMDIIELHRKYDVRLFTFVIGNSANRPLLDRLAKDSGGFAMDISCSDDIIGRILQAKAKIRHECLYNTELKFSGAKVKNLTPVYLGNLYKGQQVVVFGQYDEPGNVEIKLTGRIGGEQKTWTCRAILPENDTDNPEIERLWALSAINDVMAVIQEKGARKDLRGKVVKLGTDYSLVTDYTSMVVVKEIEMENMEIERKNADRVAKERRAQKAKQAQAVKNYRVDNQTSNPGQANQNTQQKASNKNTFKGFSAPNIGSGPVGPLFVWGAYWLQRRKKRKTG